MALWFHKKKLSSKMSTFYTNVKQYGNNILFRGIKNGKRVQAKVPYRPSLFLPTNEESKYKTIYGENLVKKRFDTIKEARQFVDQYRDVENFNIYGNTKYEYCFISEVNKTDIEWDFSKVRICIFDIEVNSDPDKGGFASPEDPHQPIISIALKFVGDEASYLLGYHDFDAPKNVHYYKCKDEWTLLKTFIEIWSLDYPDVISGWNCVPVNQHIWGKDRIFPIKDADECLFNSKIVDKSPIASKKEYEIHTYNGVVVKSSGDHKIPVRVIENEKYSKLNLSKKNSVNEVVLKTKDLLLDEEYSYFIEQPMRDNCNKNNDRYSNNSLYLAGLIYTDGSLKKKIKPTNGFNFYQSDKDLMDCLDAFGVDTTYNLSKKNNYRRTIRYKDINNSYELIYNKNGSKKLNLELISTLSSDQFYLFLSGLLDGDGCVDNNTIEWCNYNNDIEEMQQLCQWNGIFTTRSKNRLRLIDFDFDKLKLQKKSRWDKLDYRKLNRTSQQKGKQTKYKKVGDSYWVKIRNVVDTGNYVDMMDIETDTHLFVTMGCTVHNCNKFDVKYLVNRCNKIIGEQETKKLSPWKVIKEKKTRKFNPKFNQYEEDVEYSLLGISSLDYMDLFKKYHPEGKSQESYKLDHIAENEIGENKVEYDGSLHKLYTEDKNKFYLYNLQDIYLIEKINDKCRLFELGLTLAYDSKTNPEDIFFQTIMWDVLIYNFLNKRNIQLPQNKQSESQDYAGAYVKSPQTGMHKWVVSLDATSLYPSVIIGKNISPETLVPIEDYSVNMRNVMSSGVNVENLLSRSINLDFLKEDNVTITPNGQFFRTDKKGFLPEMIEKMFADRQTYKKKMIQAQKDYEVISSEYNKTNSDELKTRMEELEYDISKFNNLQNSKKLCLNSAYGALGAKQFRLFDTRLAEAITLEGQLSNRWVANNFNEFFGDLLKVYKDFIIYADTDSLIISFEDLVNKVCKNDVDPNKIANSLLKLIDNKIQPAVDSFCLELKEYVNSYKNSLSYKLEKICSTGIFVAKKRYALNVFSNEGVIYSEPKIKVTGMEIVKSSTPSIVRDSLKQCIKIMMNEDEDSLQNYVSLFKNKFSSYDVEEISFPRGVNGLNKYFDATTLYKKGTPIHVRGSILFNKLLDDKKLSSEYEYIKDGDKIKFCYLKMPNIIKENVIAFPEKLPKEFDLLENVDYNKMYDKVFLEPLKAITEVIGWEIEKRNRMEDFF